MISKLTTISSIVILALSLPSTAVLSAPRTEIRTAIGTSEAVVSNLEQLVTALNSGKKVIIVDNNAKIDLAPLANSQKYPQKAPNTLLYIPTGVTLMSGRSPTKAGGLLYLSRSLRDENQTYRFTIGMAQNTRLIGLRLRGYWQPNDTVDRGDPTMGIGIREIDNVLVENNEIYNWANAGIEVINIPNDRNAAATVRITRNFFHNNIQCGAGYGVVVSRKGYAFIDRNTFNYNRHAVASDGLPQVGYIAEQNFILSGGYTCYGNYQQHFDMHGTGGGSSHVGGDAGEYLRILGNTIRGEQDYGVLGLQTRRALSLRGIPKIGAVFSENVMAHDNPAEAFKLYPKICIRLLQPRLPNDSYYDYCNRILGGKLTVRDNKYDVDTSNELIAGDFDGDGATDVFQATGAAWYYSPRGHREWHYLNQSKLRRDRLGFGDFDGNGTTDVFTQSGDEWLVSYGATTQWTPLPAGSNIPMNTYRFGKFDNDNKTDIFRANGSRWYYSSGGAGSWQPLQSSSYGVGDLRFGDFNGDGMTDVFSFANGNWSVSYSGATKWQKLNDKISSNLNELVFGDFNRDGVTDIARGGGNWEVSWGGRTSWFPLFAGGSNSLDSMLIGDFNGDGYSDGIAYEQKDAAAKNKFTMWNGLGKVFEVRSEPEMR